MPHDEFLTLFLQSQSEVRAFIGSLIPDRHLRDDVFQEVALTLWRKFDEYEIQRSFGAWARGIAARKVLQLRHEATRFPIALSPEAITAVLAAYDRTETEASQQRDALEECLRSLPDESRRILQLKYERDLKSEEIASLMDRTVDAIYQSLCRIRVRLGDCVKRRLAQECRLT